MNLDWLLLSASTIGVAMAVLHFMGPVTLDLDLNSSAEFSAKFIKVEPVE